MQLRTYSVIRSNNQWGNAPPKILTGNRRRENFFAKDLFQYSFLSQSALQNDPVVYSGCSGGHRSSTRYWRRQIFFIDTTLGCYWISDACLIRNWINVGGCKAPVEITAETGVISSPYYNLFPEFQYPNNAKCRWTINVPMGKVRFSGVRLQCFSLDEDKVVSAGNCRTLRLNSHRESGSKRDPVANMIGSLSFPVTGQELRACAINP